ncbi:MAG: helix-hairpin-helix domain-containing protein [Pseudomonadota bacterium]|nr:helix-hairpin-helix domain-containing protein [Pseudomonadota bacterium]
MKKLFLLLVMSFAFTGAVCAAVNINTATQAELEMLQGIGPAKAKAIIDYRKKNGLFKSPNDLEKVNGIGPGIMKRLRKDVTIGGTTTVKKEIDPLPSKKNQSAGK